jgi:hypothetical protein
LSSPTQTERLTDEEYLLFFDDLESQLSTISHTDVAAKAIETAVTSRFKKTSQRQIAFATPGVITVEPVGYDGVVAAGKIPPSEDRFFVLQGDIVETEAAYFMGDRVTGRPLFTVLNSTCDLVPGRRDYASLLRVIPVSGTPDQLKSTLHQLLSFRSRRDLYLPGFPGENPTSLGYAVRFDGVAQIRMGDLLLARRVCSLTLVGWRIFGSFARVLISRAGESEVQLRKNIRTHHK